MLFRSAALSVLARAIDSALADFGERMAYSFLGRAARTEVALTGSELRDLARVQAEALQDAHPTAQSALLALPPGIGFLNALLGCIYSGIAAIPAPANRPGPGLARLLAGLSLKPDVVFVAKGERAKMEALCAERGLKPVLIVEALEDPTSFPTASKRIPKVLDCPDDPARIAILQLTSGTSGEAKAVRVPNSAVLANANLAIEHWKLTRDDRSLTWLPHYHDMGLFGGLIFPLIAGVEIHQMAPLRFLQRPALWIQAASERKITMTGAPAFALDLVREKMSAEEISAFDLQSLRGIFCGAEPIRPGLLSDFAGTMESAGLPPSAPFPCYGLAEATLLVAGAPRSHPQSGVTVFDDPRHRLSIMDQQTGLPLPEGAEGEICVNSTSVADGYAISEDQLAPFSTSDFGTGAHWLRTGDLGRIVAGQLTISGRVKEIFIVNGVNIAPSEIEWYAGRTLPELNPNAAAAFQFGTLLDKSSALVVELKRGIALSLEDREAKKILRGAIRSEFGLELDQIKIVRSGTLPRTTSGKIRRLAARHLLDA